MNCEILERWCNKNVCFTVPRETSNGDCKFNTWEVSCCLYSEGSQHIFGEIVSWGFPLNTVMRTYAEAKRRTWVAVQHELKLMMQISGDDARWANSAAVSWSATRWTCFKAEIDASKGIIPHEIDDLLHLRSMFFFVAGTSDVYDCKSSVLRSESSMGAPGWKYLAYV